MALRRRINYQWRVLFPLVILIWVVVIALGVYMYLNDRRLKIDSIRSQVALVNSRIIHAYDYDQDPVLFLDFIDDYYVKHPLFDKIRISIYYSGKLIYHIGAVIEPETDTFSGGSVMTDTEARRMAVYTDRVRNNFFHEVSHSADGTVTVYTILPFDRDVMRASRASTSVFIVLIFVALVATGFAYLMARRIGRNLLMLRDFADRAATDPSFVPSTDFAHDEFGDISRQIVRFYNERCQSILKLKREHNVAMHAVTEKTNLKRELTNNINHELKTPIGVIKGYLDTIIEHPEMDDASRNHFLTKVSEHVDRLIRLLEDLSSITRLEYGSKMINTEPVDFHEVVFQAVSDLETSGVMGNMVFNYDIPPYCRVVGNVGLLTAMINNLAKNAAAYSKGTECNLILIDKDEDFFHFAFYDDGVGVKDSSLPHLFERFFREDSGRSRKRGGTGLGLCIVQNTVEALGGTITASNRDSGGLIFRFTLKIVK